MIDIHLHLQARLPTDSATMKNTSEPVYWPLNLATAMDRNLQRFLKISTIIFLLCGKLTNVICESDLPSFESKGKCFAGLDTEHCGTVPGLLNS